MFNLVNKSALGTAAIAAITLGLTAGRASAWVFEEGLIGTRTSFLITHPNDGDVGNCDASLDVAATLRGGKDRSAIFDFSVIASGAGFVPSELVPSDEQLDMSFTGLCDGVPGTFRIRTTVPTGAASTVIVSFAGGNAFGFKIVDLGTENIAPVSAAGDAVVVAGDGSTVELNGSASDGNFPGGDPAQIFSFIEWSAVTNGAPDLQNANTLTPTFPGETLAAGAESVNYTYQLVVFDNNGVASEASEVTVTVNPPPNVAPTANAGADQTGVASEATVTLDGSGSTDSDGTVASHAWSQTSGPSVTLSSATAASPTFTAPTLTSNDSAKTLVFSLTVTDDDGAASTADTVSITVTPPANAAPTANAGTDQTGVASAATVTLDGSGSTDSDGTVASFAWTQTSGTTVTLSDATAASPTFTAPTLTSNDSAETLVFSLIVTDDDGTASTADTVSITVTPPANAAPTANAGPDQTGVASDATVTLDGSGSTDSDGTVASFAWTQTSGTTVTLSDATAASPTFTAPTLTSNDSAETLVFSLTVTDDDGTASTADTVSITVTPPSDTTPPAAPTEENTDVVTNADGSITVSGMTEPGATVRVTFPDGMVVSSQASGTGAYAITSAPSQPTGDVKVIAVDAAGNASAMLSMMVVAGPTVEETQQEIATYMQSRAGHILAAQPDLIGMLSGSVSGGFNLAATDGNGSFDFSKYDGTPVWARVKGSWSTSGENENSYFFGAVGAHMNLGENAIAGIMLEYDLLSQENGDTKTDGTGWLAGPYVVAKLPDQPLFFEGRYLVGKTENTVSVDGAEEQDFDTNRSLASLKVAGRLVYDDLVLTPSLSASRLEDEQKAFTDNAGRAIAAQSITVTDVAASLDFSKPFRVDGGELVLTGGLAAVYSAVDGEGFASTITPDYEGGRGRLHIGTRYTADNGVILRAGASYDGLGADDYESFGLEVGIDVKF